MKFRSAERVIAQSRAVELDEHVEGDQECRGGIELEAEGSVGEVEAVYLKVSGGQYAAVGSGERSRDGALE